MSQPALDLLLETDADAPSPGVGSDVPAGLRVHSGPRADVLAGALAELLAEPLDDPFATEVVSVPTPGVERWLAQTLAERLGPSGDGVCAGVAFPGLDALLEEVVREATGAEERTGDPWHPRRLVWSCLRTFETVAAEPWFAPVATHLRGAADTDELVGSGRRWSTARRLARLFASYASERPAMVDAWRAGHDVGSDLGPVPDDLAWQPRLWRALAAEVGTPDPAQRLTRAVAALRERG
ncbi:exodeoxyribonuclease V subunit gamma, partial [Desertihabitans aurantiacus]|uniref:exodeoxyribonuclease V subunit gamma n=1 Tax=Desertihabitans aurantiacus TaxID=2282477 RepID=UPI0018E5A98D